MPCTGDGLYYESGDTLWVNVYAPSTADWTAAGARLTMTTSFPEGETAGLALEMTKPRRFTISLRRPFWAGDGFSITVNGVPVKDPGPADPSSASSGSGKRGQGGPGPTQDPPAGAPARQSRQGSDHVGSARSGR